MNTKPILLLSRVFFLLGVITSLTLSLIAIWNNIEATSYFFSGAAYPPFPGLRCPLLIAPTEKGIVTAAFSNPTDKEDTFYYKAQISGKASSMRTIEDKIAVPPRQAMRIQWTVDADDVVLHFFILVKITILPNAVHSAQEAFCGIMVTNILGLGGAQVTAAALIFSLLGIAGGLAVWQQTRIPAKRDAFPLARALGIVVLLALFTAWMSWWGAAIALSVITILLMVVSLRFAVD